MEDWKALQSVWSKEEIERLERRLARLKEELNLHLVVEFRCVRMAVGIDWLTRYALREQVSQCRQEQLDSLDLTTQRIVHAIDKEQDLFRVMRDTHITVVKNEHAVTRHEINQEIRVRLSFESPYLPLN